VSAYREPLARRARRWGRRNRTTVAAAAVAVLAALFGTAAVLAVQTQANGRLKRANTSLAIANDRITKANADLKSANEREKQRFDLAMEAIRLQGEVGDDVATSLFAAAFLLAETGKSAEALSSYEEARELLKGLPLSGTGSNERRALLGTVDAGDRVGTPRYGEGGRGVVGLPVVGG